MNQGLEQFQVSGPCKKMPRVQADLVPAILAASSDEPARPIIAKMLAPVFKSKHTPAQLPLEQLHVEEIIAVGKRYIVSNMLLGHLRIVSNDTIRFQESNFGAPEVLERSEKPRLNIENEGLRGSKRENANRFIEQGKNTPSSKFETGPFRPQNGDDGEQVRSRDVGPADEQGLPPIFYETVDGNQNPPLSTWDQLP